MSKTSYLFITLLPLALLFTACATTNNVPAVNKESFHSSTVSKNQIVAKIPDYRDKLTGVKGKAKAIVSGPEKTHRVTLYFAGNRQRSLIDVRNSIGIKGAKILAFGDSLLIYNKVKKYARKISVKHSHL